MKHNLYFVLIPTRVGNMVRSLTGRYNDAIRLGKTNLWAINGAALAKANRHSVRHLRTYRQAGRKTVADLLSLSARLS